jgi:very-short-patch-repair endonuclease
MNHYAHSDGPVSKAEITVFTELSRMGLTHGMTTQDTIILRMTIPDFLWREKKKALYLDGVQVHGTDRAIANDTEIDNLLEKHGWSVLRLPYNPPLTGKALTEIMNKITEFIGEK